MYYLGIIGVTNGYLLKLIILNQVKLNNEDINNRNLIRANIYSLIVFMILRIHFLKPILSFL